MTPTYHKETDMFFYIYRFAFIATWFYASYSLLRGAGRLAAKFGWKIVRTQMTK